MNPTNDKLPQQPTPGEQPQQPKVKRFRIVRLEERIAPRSAMATDHGPKFTHRCPSF
jgi:hypothetical protein